MVLIGATENLGIMMMVQPKLMLYKESPTKHTKSSMPLNIQQVVSFMAARDVGILLAAQIWTEVPAERMHRRRSVDG